MKLLSIFKALDGAHLDRLVFGPHVSETTRSSKRLKSEKARVSGGGATSRRNQGLTKDRTRTKHATYPDTGAR